MKWRDHLKRIRRFLRDPDGEIWDNSFLLNAFNDEQKELAQRFPILVEVQALPVPPRYGTGYTHDWEYAYCDQDLGKPHKVFIEDAASGGVFNQAWEIEANWNDAAPVTSGGGASITQPWEAWAATANEPVPFWFPPNFGEAKMVAWDENLIDNVDVKQIQSVDSDWMTHAGQPQAYYRKDATSNEFYLYPQPESVTWDDESGKGQVLFTDSDTVSQENGTVLYRADYVNQEQGIALDIIDAADNILLIYSIEPVAMLGIDDASDWPSFLTKYIEYGVLERAYAANTDGRIESLRDYWGTRRKVGHQAIERYMKRRTADRDYRLVSKGGGGRRNERGPRLPDHYPAV